MINATFSHRWLAGVKSLFATVFLLIISTHYASADLIGIYAIITGHPTTIICNDYATNATDAGSSTDVEFLASQANCTYSSYAPPHSGYYRQRVIITGTISTTITSDKFYLDGNKTIAEQNVYLSGPSKTITYPPGSNFLMCYYLVDDSEKLYGMFGDFMGCHGGMPLPPTPPVPDTSCTINSGNTLSVSLGTLDRAEIPTTAGAGVAKSVPFAVNCTGGNVSVKMQLNYTPIAIGSSQAVKTSANGVGVAVLYDSKPLETTSSIPVTFLEGANTLNLSFQAVRDPAVGLGDIPTGAFTANAVLVLTQQ